MKIRTLYDLDLENKKILVRVDYNVPLKDGMIQDNNRIVQTLPTLKEMIRRKASLILVSHLGRPKPAEIGKRDIAYSLKPVRRELEVLLGLPVDFCEDLIGEEVTAKAGVLKPGQVLLLENVRYYQEETEKDTEKRYGFAKKLASLADIFVNDAFGAAHREHASTTTVGEFLPAAAGLLMEKEIRYLGQALGEVPRSDKFRYGKTAVIGGAKISSKIPLINNLLDKVDKILIGGGMTYTFYKALGYEIGKSLLDPELIDTCKKILEKGKHLVVLPDDTKVGDIDFDSMLVRGELQTVAADAIPPDLEAVDIGPATVKKYLEIIHQSHTLIWNGPMGVFECPAAGEGTFAMAQGMVAATRNGSVTIVGGGDSASALKQAKLQDQVTHLSTGGGASLEFLEGKTLPGVAILEK